MRETDVGVGDARVRAGVDGDRTELRERARAREIVVVDVRLERMRHEDAEPRGDREVRVDVAVGIDEESDARVWVGAQVARVAEPGVEELLDQHRRTIQSGGPRPPGKRA